MTHMTLQAVRQLIANDSYAITFQSVEQYRATLLRHVDSLVDGTQQYSSGGTVPAELRLVGEGLRPLSAPAAQQAAAPCALLAILRDVHDTLASESDSDLDHFEDDDEEREGAPVQYAARKVMEVMDILKAASSAPDTPEAPQTAAARDVLAERQRQVEVERWTPAHDDHHDSGQMAVAAGYYALACGWPKERDIGRGKTPVYWPWAPEWWKPRTKRENLVRSGALVLAEIERLDRAAQLDGGQGEETT